MYPISAMVVCYNESRRLPQCLESLAFCDERMVIDLGSSDDSVAIARRMGVEVRNHPRVPIAEAVRMAAVPWARHDWILQLDPDEVFPTHIAERMWAMTTADPLVGCVAFPWQTYFRGKPLHGTRMGRIPYKHVLVHRERMQFDGIVHRGKELRPGYKLLQYPHSEADAIKHYWVDTYSQYFEKHWRYIVAESNDLYRAGVRFWWQRVIRDVVRSLRKDLIQYKGLQSGPPAWFVSAGYAWYYGMIQLRLWQCEHNAQKVNTQKVNS